MIFKLFLISIALALSACAHSSMQSLPVNTPFKKANTNAATPAPTPPVQATLSECSQKRAVGLPSGVNIPQEVLRRRETR